MEKIRCTVGILTYNSGVTLRRALESGKDFSEIIVNDGGSTDDTLSIAEEYGARVIVQDGVCKNADGTLKDFSCAKNQLLRAARNDWFLVIDSDEAISEGLCGEIRQLVMSEDTAHVYNVPIRIILDGKEIKYSSNYPGYQHRFFNKKSAAHFEKPVHEKVTYDTIRYTPRTLTHPWYVFTTRDEMTHYLRSTKKYIDMEARKGVDQPFGEYLRFSVWGNILKSAKIVVKALYIYLRHGGRDTLPVRAELGRALYPLVVLGEFTCLQWKRLIKNSTPSARGILSVHRKESASKTICFFGIYDPMYARARVLREGFRIHGYNVVECCVDPAIGALKKFGALYGRYRALPEKQFDHVIVMFPGHSVVWLARLLFGKNIIFDAFVSLYNTEVEDRKRHRKGSIAAHYYSFLDRSAVGMAWGVLLDTNAHIEYFAKRYRVAREKFVRVFVGTTTDLFYPGMQVTPGPFTVHFHGGYSPLQGAKYIVAAAGILKDKGIRFSMIGDGQEYRDARSFAQTHNIDTIEFIPRVALAELGGYIQKSSIVLGVFGVTSKTAMVIPNKIYEALACGKPVITADTPAAAELLKDTQSALLVPPGDPEALARAIMTLRSDDVLRDRIAEKGHEIFLAEATPKVIVGNILKQLPHHV